MEEFREAEREFTEASDQAWIDHLKNTTNEDMKEICALEADRLMALKIEEDIARKDKQEIEQDIKDYEDAIKKKRPILSFSNAWRERKLDARRQKVTASLKSSRLERVALRLEQEELHAQSSARKLAAHFREHVREDLDKRLRGKQSSLPPAKFEVLQLNPNNWSGGDQDGFKRCKTVEVDLGKPFWRVHNSWMIMVSVTKSLVGGAYHFLTSGPFSLRALFSRRPYYAVQRPVRDPGSLTSTLASRLNSFHSTLKSKRAVFESTPDTGLIGKSIQRFFLRSYLAFKGAIGTVWILAFMTVGTAISTLLTTVVLAAAPVLAVAATLATMLFNFAIYDTAIGAARNRFVGILWFGGDPEMPSSVSPLLKIGIGVPYCLIVAGALQAALSLVRICVIHPLAGIAHLLWASLRFTMRSLRDSFTWFFIRKYSRIPAADTWLARRIHGPGLAPTQYYRIPIEAAKASVLLLLDKYRLLAHEQVRRAELEAPYERYRALFDTVVRPFGMGIVLNVPSPSSVAFRISSHASTNRRQSQYIDDARTKEHVFDIWEVVAQGIHSSDPSHCEAQESYTLGQWNAAARVIGSDSDIDRTIRFDVEANYEEHKSKGETELDEMVNRAGKVLAEWTLQIELREERLTQAIAIPPSALGCFRSSQIEQQDLWKFTLEAVEMYSQQLKAEVEGILFVSEFSLELEPTVRHVINSFYTHSGARPGKDIPAVASFLLSQLLGGEHMLETLEETDEKLVLSPKMSEEDEHLVFWRGFLLE